jgi:hypothetical protein
MQPISENTWWRESSTSVDTLEKIVFKEQLEQQKNEYYGTIQGLRFWFLSFDLPYDILYSV